jgi:alpha-1,6-mannosyltransferase
MASSKPWHYFLIAFSAAGYYLIAYCIERHESVWLISVYTLLFAAYAILVNKVNEEISLWVTLAILFRCIFIVSMPALSDDFYRFIWDGRLWHAGHHPFTALPGDYLAKDIPGLDDALFQKLNSKEYFTVYPPLSQGVFWLATGLSPDSISGSVIIMRIVLLLSEIGNFWLMRKLLRQFNLPSRHLMLYALNPLVIIELTGNLHFETLVIFFLLLSAWALSRQQKAMSLVSLVLAFATKLVPVVFFPSWFRMIGRKYWLLSGLLALVFIAICFYPLWDVEAIRAISGSVGLYFNKFEFNASLYYLVREFGYWRYGYNIIQTVGWKLSLITALLILLFTFRRGVPSDTGTDIPSLLHDWMWIMVIYFLFTTTLHPWYITTLLAVSVFASYRFAALWTYFIFLSYTGYTQEGFHENLWITALEYIAVYSFMVYEIALNRSRT